MSETKLCCNCLHCARWRKKDGIETHCDLNDKYLGYLQVMEENTECKHWEKETKWDLQREHDKQIRADAIDEFVSSFEKEFAPNLDENLITMIEFNKWFENVTKIAEQIKE